MLMEQTDSEDTVRVLEEYRKRQPGIEKQADYALSSHCAFRGSAAAVHGRIPSGAGRAYRPGVLALIECLERYDPDRGARFETFAFMRVRGAMIDYIRSQDWVPHRARNFQKK